MTTNTITRRRLAWRAALLMGLVSGTYSTLLITVGAARIGRNPAIDWMDIGTVLLGLDAIRAEPGLREIAAGILVHQTADLWWTVVFFALGRRWTLMLTAKTLLVIALPWAFVTSAIEYYLLLPRLQPLVPMQVPYWTALLVHVTSAAAYPLFPWIRSRVAGVTDAVAARWASRTVVVLALVALPPAVIEARGGSAREVRWPFVDVSSSEFDRTFMQQMAAHHDAGVQLARLALQTELTPEPAVLARLVIAEQTREAALLRNWWRSWFDDAMPTAMAQHMSEIPGMASERDLQRLRATRGTEAERLFLRLMRDHHRGAVAMANGAWGRAADPRLRTFAYSVRHAQSGQIRWINGVLVASSSGLPRRPTLANE